MKKFFTPLLLLAMLLCSGGGWAQTIYVGGIAVNTSATSVQTVTGYCVSGTVTYDPSSRVLTLKDATIDSERFEAIYAKGFSNENPLRIEFVGSNVIRGGVRSDSENGAIHGDEDTRIWLTSSASATSVPYVYIENKGAGAAVCMEKNSRLDITKIAVVAKSTNNHCFRASTDGTIFSPCYASVNMTAPSGYAAVYGFQGFYNYIGSVPQAIVGNNGYAWNNSKRGIVDQSGNLVSSAYITPTLLIGGAPYPAYNFTCTTSSDIAPRIGLTAGTIQFEADTKTLTLANVTQSSGNGPAIRSYLNGLTIKTAGTNVFNATNGMGFDLYAPTTIAGDGSLNVTSKNTGAYLNGGVNSSLTINVNNSVTFKSTNSYAVNNNYSTAVPNNDLILKKAGDNSDYFFTPGAGYVPFNNLCHLTLNDMDFYTAGCYYDEDKRAVMKTGGNTMRSETVNLYRVNQWYDVYVAGKQLNDVSRYGRFGSKYLTSGTVNYNTDSKTLTLKNATIDMTGFEGTGVARCIIYSFVENFTIEATGENEWKSAWIGLNLGGQGTTTIKGSGTLNITSTESTALNMFGTTSLTLSRSSGTMLAKGKDFAFSGRPSTTLTINKEGQGACYQFVGEQGNIASIPSIKLGTGVNYSTAYTWFNQDEQAVFFKDGIAKATGAYSGAPTWIRSDASWTEYPVTIAGTKLYSGAGGGNVNGFWNKYVKGGDITYDVSTGTLKLSGATVDYTSAGYTNDGVVTTAQGTTLNIEAEGDNVLSSSTAYAGLWFDKSTVGIGGTGRLTVSGPYCDLYGLNGSNVTVRDAVTLEATKCGIGTNNNMESLTVRDDAVVKARQISTLNNLILLDNHEITSPEGAQFNGTTKRVEKDGALAYDVVIEKVTWYDLYIAGTQVTSKNCDDVLGNGVFSYDAEAKKLFIHGDYDYKEATASVIYSEIEDLGICVTSDSRLSSNLTGGIIQLANDTYLTSVDGSLLTLQGMNEDGVSSAIDMSNGVLTLDHLQLDATEGNFFSGICGTPSNGTRLDIFSSDISVKANGAGAISKWSAIILDGCVVVEPTSLLFLPGAIAYADGTVVGKGKEGTVVISSDPDAIRSVPSDGSIAEEVYDLSGRKLSQAGKGVSIIVGADGKARKVLRK